MMEFFSVYDAAAARYIDPFPAPTLEVALREFRQACEDKSHHFRRFSEDYSLWHVGHFDPELGIISAVVPVSKIAMASAYVTPEELAE